MELKEFIRETISQITEGVIESQKEMKEKGFGVVNPPEVINTDYQGRRSHGISNPSFVEFEVSLTNAESSESKSGIGVLLGSINIGTGNKNESKDIALTKVKFSIPIIYSPG